MFFQGVTALTAVTVILGCPQKAEAADTDTVNTDTVLLSEAEGVG